MAEEPSPCLEKAFKSCNSSMSQSKRLRLLGHAHATVMWRAINTAEGENTQHGMCWSSICRARELASRYDVALVNEREPRRQVELGRGHLEVNLKVHGFVGKANAWQHLPAEALNGLLLGAHLLAQHKCA